MSWTGYFLTGDWNKIVLLVLLRICLYVNLRNLVLNSSKDALDTFLFISSLDDWSELEKKNCD